MRLEVESDENSEVPRSEPIAILPPSLTRQACGPRQLNATLAWIFCRLLLIRFTSEFDIKPNRGKKSSHRRAAPRVEGCASTHRIAADPHPTCRLPVLPGEEALLRHQCRPAPAQSCRSLPRHNEVLPEHAAPPGVCFLRRRDGMRSRRGGQVGRARYFQWTSTHRQPT